ncbi:uncharacterized protein I303_100337 [Kwoniella dejecticola CBS 10117]|uniref:Uncharacterized protein n=1 Tax=Kwoniella dejecticola CBS 10117 TaxID=1296121 RepID=A0A1A6AEM2_9TREE|nr:uncharacterized protein I303_00338 [Kwoniella dejecticola CBS 10117]OBR88521.1 hypothetical protein I303_00338 [Kwoniella dejecticola CBS 10117]
MSSYQSNPPMVLSGSAQWSGTVIAPSIHATRNENDRLSESYTGHLTIVDPQQGQSTNIDTLPVFSRECLTDPFDPNEVFSCHGDWGSIGGTVSERFIDMGGYAFAVEDTKFKGNVKYPTTGPFAGPDRLNEEFSLGVNYFVDTAKHYKSGSANRLSSSLGMISRDTISKFDTIQLGLALPEDKQWLNSALSSEGLRNWVPSHKDTGKSLTSVPGDVAQPDVGWIRRHQVKVGDSIMQPGKSFRMRVVPAGTRLKDPNDKESLDRLYELFGGKEGLGVACDVSMVIRSIGEDFNHINAGSEDESDEEETEGESGPDDGYYRDDAVEDIMLSEGPVFEPFSGPPPMHMHGPDDLSPPLMAMGAPKMPDQGPSISTAQASNAKAKYKNNKGGYTRHGPGPKQGWMRSR